MSSSRASVLVSALGLSITTADDALPPDHGHDHAAATPDAATPYAERYDAEAAIRSLTPEDIDQIRRGEAEPNGLPGPRQVLDLAHELHLSHEQRRCKWRRVVV